MSYLTKEQRDGIIEEVFDHFHYTYGSVCKMSLAPNVPEAEVDAFLDACREKLWDWSASKETPKEPPANWNGWYGDD